MCVLLEISTILEVKQPLATKKNLLFQRSWKQVCWTKNILRIALVASRLPQLPIDFMENSDLSADIC